MRIESATTYVVGNPDPRFGGRYFVFVKLRTDDGVEGIGEVYGAAFGPRSIEAMVEEVCARHVIGADPFGIEVLWRNVYGRGYSARSDITLLSVLSALEMACWDIVGKALERPAYELLGGLVHDRLRTYTYLYPAEGDAVDVYGDPDLAAERAAAYADRGFTAVKFDPADRYTTLDPRQPRPGELDRVKTYVRRIREAVGGRCDLLIGTHGQFTTAGAIRFARCLEPYDPLWLEEPVPPDMPEQMAVVARSTCIPIATGERLAGKFEFGRVLASGAASILQMDLGRVGGLLEAKKIAGMAEAHYAQIAPHLYCGPIAAAANVQLAACSPNFLILEGIGAWDGFHADLLKVPIRWEDGYVIPPTAPGLGVELDEEVARAHPYEGDALHLEPDYIGLVPAGLPAHAREARP
ncbi:MAG TPA: mandelate racemase/muconate lactonizing enzyme family protein [Solirubrobacteraceae bacterium]|nr:mandelate racemase/muconate lactonizing enzyme family protein [Solirubrobacteraceae bacterium]